MDDVLETVNHFKCIDLIIDKANYELSESLIKKLHFILKNGIKSSSNKRFALGDYKKYPNIVGDTETVKPENVAEEMQKMLNNGKIKNLTEILDI